MKRFPLYLQHDSMQCGAACLAMVCKYYGRNYSLAAISKYCVATNEGVSLLGIRQAAETLGLSTIGAKVTLEVLLKDTPPSILHWNQNYFVVLYKVTGRKGRERFHVADPARGRMVYSREEFCRNWISVHEDESFQGIVLFLEPKPWVDEAKLETDFGDRRSWRFILGYLRTYRRYFIQIIAGLLVGCLLQLILPFLTQAIVDVGITHHDLGFVWLVLLGQLMLTISRTAIDFIRHWLLLHISMRINISLVSDFFIKLLKLPMSFFDTKLLGDLMQRISDHSRVEKFLTTQTLNIAFSLLSFVIFGIVLLVYNQLIFVVFLLCSALYGGWLLFFLKRRRQLDYEVFEKQAINSNNTYQLLTSMQEIKLQGCEQRRRWEWEDVQCDLFQVQMKSLKLKQTQEAGGIFINEMKNILITVLSATAVIHGEMTLGMMLAVQYIIGQLNSPVEQLMNFCYSLQDVNISLERINEIHTEANEENDKRYYQNLMPDENDLVFDHAYFKYDPHSLKNIIEDVSLRIRGGQVIPISKDIQSRKQKRAAQ